MSKVRKALIAAVLAGVAAAVGAVTQGPLTAASWGEIAGAMAAAGWAVWRVPNAPVQGGPRR